MESGVQIPMSASELLSQEPAHLPMSCSNPLSMGPSLTPCPCVGEADCFTACADASTSSMMGTGHPSFVGSFMQFLFLYLLNFSSVHCRRGTTEVNKPQSQTSSGLGRSKASRASVHSLLQLQVPEGFSLLAVKDFITPRTPP